MIHDFDGFDNILGRSLAAVYGRLRELDRRRKLRRPPVRAPIPTLSVGNITVGGTGKTPMVGYLAAQLRARGKRPAILMRGYLASEAGPIRVPADGSVARFGDEPLMLARRGHCVWIARKREEGVTIAADNADVLLLDDGFQRLEVARDLDLVMFGPQGLGNGKLLPAGILRDPPAALAAADAFCGSLAGIPALYPHTPRFGFSNRALIYSPQKPQRGERLAAIAAIARPQHFFAALTADGRHLEWTCALNDHDPFEAGTRQYLAHALEKRGIDAVLVTEKDSVKLGEHLGPARVVVVTADYGPDDEATAVAFWRFLKSRLPI